MSDAWRPSDERSLTIAHVANYYMPGYGYQENYLPFSQAALGHRVHIVTSDRLVPDQRFAQSRDELTRIVGPGVSTEREVTLHRLPVMFELRRRNNPFLRKLSRTINSIAPDVIHLHGVTPLSTLTTLLASPRTSAVVVDHHLCRFNLAPWSGMKAAYYFVFRNVIIPLFCRRVDAWLPINEDAQAVLDQVLGVRGRRVFINRLGADIDNFQLDRQQREAVRRRLAISPEQRVAIHAGRIGPRKDIDVLLRAWANMTPKDVLIVAGHAEGELKHELDRLAAADGGEVRFLPMQSSEELAGLFNAADLAVWPGDASVTLLQAMACGLPLVIAHDPGLDYVAGCPYASVFPRGDVAALTDVLLRQPERGATREEREKIAAFCRGRFDWNVIATESIDIYRAASRRV